MSRVRRAVLAEIEISARKIPKFCYFCHRMVDLRSQPIPPVAFVSQTTHVMEEAKRKRYDRQLRIWGEHGQARLENCKVCLLHCGPTGVEAIKNLVLGGIHSFTLVDDALVTPRDLGNNFFVHESDLGKGRAASVAKHMHDLNNSVTGSFVDERVDDVVTQNPDFFADFTVVVASQCLGSTLAKLDAVCRAHDVALVALTTHGLVGTVRVSRLEQRVLEAKPEETDFDLRVNQPWPELVAFARNFVGTRFHEMTETQRAHVPWAVTLINAFDEFDSAKETHVSPIHEWTGEDRVSIKKIIKKQFMDASAQTAELGDAALPENCTEALANARHAWKPLHGVLPAALLETLADPKLDNLETPDTPVFWFLLAGLKEFLQNPEGGQIMPVEGSIPDMTSTTKWYVALQTIYRDKSNADAAAVGERARRLLRLNGRSDTEISDEDARFFCKHALHAHVIRWRTVDDELKWRNGAGAALASSLRNNDDTVKHCAARYVVHRAVDLFRETRGRYPGTPVDLSMGDSRKRKEYGDTEMTGTEDENPSRDSSRDVSNPPKDVSDPPKGCSTEHVSFGGVCDVPGDTASLRQIVETLLTEINVHSNPANVLDVLTTEAVRCAGGEPHAVAAVIGGIGAQEVIKIVTEQFTPCARTLVYDAAKAVTATVL